MYELNLYDNPAFSYCAELLLALVNVLTIWFKPRVVRLEIGVGLVQ